MSAMSRRKGVRGESEVAAIFRAHGFDCDRTPNSGGLRIKGDLTGTVPAHLEVKRQEVLRLPLWIAQAEADAPAGVLPVVAYRTNRMPWRADLPLEQFAALLRVRENTWEDPGDGRTFEERMSFISEVAKDVQWRTTDGAERWRAAINRRMQP